MSLLTVLWHGMVPAYHHVILQWNDDQRFTKVCHHPSWFAHTIDHTTRCGYIRMYHIKHPSGWNASRQYLISVIGNVITSNVTGPVKIRAKTNILNVNEQIIFITNEYSNILDNFN